MLRLPAALAALLIALLACAQELTVTDFRPTINPMTVDMQRRDANNSICAIVKVELPVAGATFSGNVVGDTPLRTSEYWVYMTPGTKMLQVKCPGHYPLMVDFRQLGCDALREKTIYTLRLKPDASVAANGSVAADPGANYLVLDITPKTGAQVKIDNQLQTVKNGSVRAYLKYGTHTYSVEADGYAPVTGTAEITAQGKVVRTIVLESAMSQLTVTGQTPGCRIFVNDEEKGTGSWTGSLPAGFYKVELRKEGYKPAVETVELAQSDNKTLTVPPLRQLFGILNVDCDPVGATISIDGKNVGNTPDRFTGIPVGEHEVMIAMQGYRSVRETVRVTEGKEERVTGSLQKITSSQQSDPLYGGVQTSANEKSMWFDVNGIPFEMIFVEGGIHKTGGEKDQWGHKIPVRENLLSDFYLGRYPVTEQLWNSVMGLPPVQDENKALWPVNHKSYEDIQQFISRISDITGCKFRLPTETEWEYAGMGGKKSKGYKYAGSNDLDSVGLGAKERVGLHKANELGFYDMTSRIFAGELCADFITYESGHDHYRKFLSYSNPMRKKEFYNGEYHVVRNGYFTHNAAYCRNIDNVFSFRLAMDSKEDNKTSAPNFVPQNNFQTFNVNGYQFELAVVDSDGPVTLGDVEEGKSRTVTLPKYAIGKFEVTEGLWKAVMGKYSRKRENMSDSLPVYGVRYDKIRTFFTKLNKITGKNFRLPNEDEWEYAARGGKYSHGFRFSGSDNLDNVGFYYGNSKGKVSPVGRLLPNELGLFDMSGNLQELCLHDNLPIIKGEKIYLRGGGVYSDLYDIKYLRGVFPSTDYEDYMSKEDRTIGFRLVLTL